MIKKITIIVLTLVIALTGLFAFNIEADSTGSVAPRNWPEDEPAPGPIKSDVSVCEDDPSLVTIKETSVGYNVDNSLLEVDYTEHGERVYSSATGEVRASNIDIDLQMYSGKRWISVATPSDIVSYNNTVVRYYEGPYKTSYRTVHTAYALEEVKLEVIVNVGISDNYRIVWTIEGLSTEVVHDADNFMQFGLNEAGDKVDFAINWQDVISSFGNITTTSFENGTFEAVFDLGRLESGSQVTLDPVYTIDTQPKLAGNNAPHVGTHHGIARTTDGRLWVIACVGLSATSEGAIMTYRSDDFGQNWVGEQAAIISYPSTAPPSYCYPNYTEVAIVAQENDIYAVYSGSLMRRRPSLGWMGEEVWDSNIYISDVDACSGTTKGELHIVYHTINDVYYIHRNSDVGGYDARVLIHDNHDGGSGKIAPNVVINDIGDIFVMWQVKRLASPYYNVGFRWYDDSTSTWTATQYLESYELDVDMGRMTIVGDYLYAVYSQRDGATSDMYLRRFHMPTNTWDTDIKLWDNNVTEHTHHEISSDLAGDLWVTSWHINAAGGAKYQYRRHHASENITTWDAAVGMDDFAGYGTPIFTWMGGMMDDPNGAWSKADVGFVFAAARDDGATQYIKYYTNAFYTTDYPDVRTDAASSIATTTATLNSYLIDDGGNDCRLAFDYDIDSGEPYDASTVWSAYIYGNGSSYNDGISGLDPGTCYYYVATAENSLYSDKGDEESFITLPEAPTGITATTTGGNRIQLAWTLGNGADSTMIRRSEGGYPADETSGDLVYFGSLTSHLDEGLTAGTTYYYRLWSYTTESCGSTYGEYGQDFETTSSSELPWVTTVAATSLGSSTATLNGLLNWDGDENCQYRFAYGNASGTPYTSATSWTGSINTDDTFNEEIAGLIQGGTYYFRAEAKNTYGVGVGSELSFTLSPAPPLPIDGVTGNCTPGDHKITLTWTKGGGASETHIRYSLTSYPTSITSGDEIYEGTASTYEHLALENGVTVYYTLWGKEGDEYSPTYTTASCTPGGSPSVITVGYTHLSMTEVRMHGYLSEDGGGLCDVRFEYDTGTGAPYSFSTTWVAAVSDDEYYADLDGLSGNSTYYFRAHALSGSTNAYGAELNFSTYESLMAPTNFVCYPITDTQIELSWTLGYGSSNTLIRYKTGSYSTGIGDGTEGYFGPDASTVINNLTPGQTYYFSAWGEDGGLYSGSVALSLCTASGQPGPDVTPTPGPGTPPPDAPPNWWTSPSCDKVDGLPGFGLMENFYNHFQIPSGTMCMGMALLIITILGVGTFVITRGHILAAMIVVIIAIGLASTLLLIPGWVMLVMVIVGGGLGFVLYKLT